MTFKKLSNVIVKIFNSKSSEEKKLWMTDLKTRKGLFDKLARAVAGKSRVDDGLLTLLTLVASDVGVETTLRIERLEKRVARDKYFNANELNFILREETEALLWRTHSDSGEPFDFTKKPYVIMVVGVNRWENNYHRQAALDLEFREKCTAGCSRPFRQLPPISLKSGLTGRVFLWSGSRWVLTCLCGVRHPVICPGTGSDVVLIDTAGRLHNRVNLMNELTKIRM